MRERHRPDLRNLGTVALLIAVVWLVRNWHTDGFGFYEDDFWRVPRAMEWSWARLWEELSSIFLGFGGYQGRPLHFALIQLLAWVGNKIGALQGAYWIGYTIVATNSVLFYFLLRRVAGRELLVLPCALAYALYPADTTQSYLTHTLGAQPALTFLLAAALLYFSRWRPLSYVVSVGAVLSYETVFPVFLAIPLLDKTWDRAFWRRCLIHVSIVGAMLGVAGVLRRMAGEGRVDLVEPAEAIGKTLYHLVIGPLVSLSGYFVKPAEALANSDGEIQLFFALALIVFLVRFSFLNLPERGSAESRDLLRHATRLAAAGAAMIVVSYLLSFTLDATFTHGRHTRVHLAATPGAALIIGSLVAIMLSYAGQFRAGLAGVLLAAGFFASLVPAGLAVQQDYVRCWNMQRQSWTEIVRQTPDLEPGMVIFAESVRGRSTQEMQVWSWAVRLILPQLYEFPTGTGPHPRVFGLTQNWRSVLEITKDLPGVAMGGPDARTFRDAEVVIFTSGEKGLERIRGPVFGGGISFPLKEPTTATRPQFPTRLLYDYLILPDES